ncbi:Ribonuclease P/MRP protein subunit Pop1 [Gracilaria domingensis]|nr:Ribonuclease P/MRP protein subunit Pop1 [Gracilaria domingensis]
MQGRSRPSIRRNRDNPEIQRNVQNATLDVVDFAVARALELRALRDAASAQSGTRRVYQQLAWHSRRRTMSHSSRRTPARLRAAHAAQLEKQRPPGKSERPPGPKGAERCRKYRKKARFLKAIRRLRSRNPAWLETHIWHAKRFQMGDVGGRHVAASCNDRGYRSAYKAATRASVIHDSSYQDIIEICGDLMSLKIVLKAVTGPHCNRVTTNPVLKGIRWVSDVVIMDGETPIGPSDVLWRPSSTLVPHESLEKDDMKVWLWIYPNLTDNVLKAIRKHAKDGTNVQRVKSPPQRFSLYGPRSGIVLASVLHNNSTPFVHVARARSSNCLPAGCVVSAETEDPRAIFPPKRMGENANKVGLNNDYGDDFQTVATNSMWSETERELWIERIASGKGKPTQERIPFILLQRTMAVAAGFEILVPPGTGMIFWNSLMYANGARAIGTEELKRLRVENLLEVFPEDYQDGEIGYALMQRERSKEEDQYNKRPPSKRVNYAVNRITSPMIPDLGGIAINETKLLGQKRKRIKLDEETKTKGLVCIIRNRSLLQQLLGMHLFQRLTHTNERRMGPTQLGQQVNSANRNRDLDEELTDRHCTYFVRVCIKPLSRGVPERNGILCEPNAADLESIRTLGSKFSGDTEKSSDPHHGDTMPSREVVGYISFGGWRMSCGVPIGIGLIAISALRRLADAGCHKKGKRGAYALFRNTKSPQYRGAILTLLPPE